MPLATFVMSSRLQQSERKLVSFFGLPKQVWEPLRLYVSDGEFTGVRSLQEVGVREIVASVIDPSLLPPIIWQHHKIVVNGAGPQCALGKYLALAILL